MKENCRISSSNSRNNKNLSIMRFFYVNLCRCKAVAKLALLLAVFFTPFVVGNAQNSVTAYQYVTKIGGHIVSQQGSNFGVFPSQEIEYVVELYKTAAGSVTPKVEISIPFYANFYGMNAVYYKGTSVGVGGLTLQGDSLIIWDISTISGLNVGDTIAKLTFTLVSSHDCYALNIDCNKEIIVVGEITVPSSGTAYEYDYPSHNPSGTSSTPVVIDATSFLAANCGGKEFREFMYLEDKTNPIPLSEISPYYPQGAVFCEDIDDDTGDPIDVVSDFPKDVPGKYAYYAYLSPGCYYQFFINVLDTTDITFCDGEKLEDARVWVSDWDAIEAGSGQWTLAGSPVDIFTYELEFPTDSGKVLKYEAMPLCSNATIFSNGIIINVHGIPEIEDTTYRSSYCVGDTLKASALVKPNGPATYQWYFDDIAMGGDSAIFDDYIIQSKSDNGKILKLVVTNHCGADSVEITINVWSNPIVLTCPLSLLYGAVSTDIDVCTAVVNYDSDIDLGGGDNEYYTYLFTNATQRSGIGNGSGEIFNEGLTTVKIIAYNDCSIDSCDFDVKVIDKQAPYITCIGDITKQPAAGVDYYTVILDEFDATATDNCTPQGAIKLTHDYSLASSNTTLDGAEFYLGTTTVTWYAEDANGNISSCLFDVIVGDKPVIAAYPSTGLSQEELCGGDDAVIKLSVISPDPAGGFADYQWLESGNIILNATDSFLIVNSAGDYSCELTYHHSGTKDTSNIIQVTKSSSAGSQIKPNLVSIPASAAICSGGLVYLYVENANAYTNPLYWWYDGHTLIKETDTSYYYAPASGSYYVVVVEDGDCAYMSDTIDVTIGGIVTPPIIKSISNKDDICEDGGMVILYMDYPSYIGVGSIKYTWFKGDTIISNNDRPMYEATEAGNYWLMVEIDGCAAASNIIPVYKSDPAIGSIDSAKLNVIPLTAEVCQIAGSVYIAVINTTSYTTPTYKWYRNDTIIMYEKNSFYIADREGKYFVVVEDGACITRSEDVFVTDGLDEIAEPIIVTYPPNHEICGAKYGVVVLELDNPGDYTNPTYQWYRGNTAIPGANTILYSAFTDGDYWLTIETGTCFTHSNTIIVTIPSGTDSIPKPLLSVNPHSGMIVEGKTTATISLTNKDAYNNQKYRWYKDGFELVYATAVPTDTSYIAEYAGWYQLLVIENDECARWSDTIWIEATECTIEQPLLTVIPSSNGVCPDNGSVLIQLANLSDYDRPTFEWYLNGTIILNETNPTIETTTPGDYWIRVYDDLTPPTPTDTNRCYMESNTETILAHSMGGFTEKPLVSVNPASNLICDNAGSVLLTFENYDPEFLGMKYYWLKDGYEMVDAMGDTVTGTVITVTDPGKYQILVVDGNCATLSKPDTIFISTTPITKPNIESVSGAVDLCQDNGSLTLRVTNGGDYTNPTFQWYKNGTAIEDAIDNHYVVTDSGRYWVYVTDDNTCSSVSDTIPITKGYLNGITPIDQPELLKYPDTNEICVGGNVMYWVNNTNAYSNAATYIWFKDTGIVAGVSESFYLATESGIYWVQVDDGCNSVSDKDTLYPSEEVAIKPIIVSTSGDSTICGDAGTIVLMLTNGHLYSSDAIYKWYNGSDMIVGADSVIYVATESGEYSLMVIDGCSAMSDTIPVTKSDDGNITMIKPIIKQDSTGNGYLCSDDGTVILYVENHLDYALGVIYNWFDTRGIVKSSTEPSYVVVSAGKYFVQVVEGLCSSSSDEIEVEENPNSSTGIIKPNLISASGVTELCDDVHASLTLYVTNYGDYSSSAIYQWYLDGAMIVGAVDNNYIAFDTGLYWVNVKDGDCSSVSDSLRIRFNDAPTADPINKPNLVKYPDTDTICEGGQVMYWVDNADDYDSPTYIWFKDVDVIKSGSESFYLATESGIYWVQVDDGCNSVSDKDTLRGGTDEAVKPIIQSVSNTTNICKQDGVIVLELVNKIYSNLAAYQWYKDGVAIAGANTQMYIATEDGVYTLFVVDYCSAMSDPITVTKDGLDDGIAEPILSDMGTVLCINGSILLSVTNTYEYSTNARYVWYDDITRLQDSNLSVYEVDKPGMYWVVVVDGGCVSISDRDTVTMGTGVVTKAEITALPESMTICGNKGVVILRLTNAAAYTNPTYQWYKNNHPILGETRGLYEATDSGSYRIEVRDGDCISLSVPIKIEKDMGKDIERPDMVSLPPDVSVLCVGGSKLLVVSNTLDYDDPRFVWYKDDDVVQDSIIPYYVVKDAGIYFVQVIDGCSARSSWNDTVTIGTDTILKPIIGTIPSNNNICGSNGMVLLTLMNPTDYANPAIQWYKNYIPILGATELAYEAYDTGVYHVQIVEQGGTCTVFSDTSIRITHVLRTIELPNIEIIPLSQNVCGDTGVVYLYVENTYDYTNPIYQWYNGNKIIPGATHSYYNATDSGYYRVFIVDDQCSVFSDSVHVTWTNTVINKPIIVSSTGGKIYGGNNVKLWLDNESMFGSDLLYYWFRNDTMITNDSIVLTNTPGKYQLLLVDGSCAAWSNIIILVDTACNMPSLVVQNLEICDSTSIDLALAVTMLTPNTIVKYYADPAAQFELSSSVVSPKSNTTYYLQAWDTITGCYGTLLASVTVTVIKLPIMPPHISDFILIDGEPLYHHFVTSRGTVIWEYVEGDSIIGLAKSGTNYIPSTMMPMINKTDSVIKATYMYTTYISSINGLVCYAPDTGYFNIEIIPIPDVFVDTNNQILCSGDTMLPILFSGRVDGTVFEWERNPIISYAGLPMSGTGDIQDSVLYNNTGWQIFLSYDVTPKFTYRGRTSVGKVAHFSITINPDPIIDPIMPDPMEYCAGTTTPVVPFTGSPGLMYEWVKLSGDSIGLADAGKGNLPTFTAINVTDTIRSAVYEVTGIYLGASCMIKDTFSILVYPTPIVDYVEDVELCNNDPLTIAFTGIGNQFSWVRITGNIPGIPSSGVGDMDFASLTNTTQGVLTASYKVTAEYVHSMGTCVGNDAYFTITLNPTPTLTDVPVNPVCSGDKFIYTAISPTLGVFYSWRRIADININGGDSASGRSQFIDETLTNTGDTTITVIYEFTLTVNGCSETYQVGVDVHPSPHITVNYITEVCPNAGFLSIPYNVINGANIEYDIIFDRDALDEGFDDTVKVKLVGEIIVRMPRSINGATPGIYRGIIRVRIPGTTCEEDIPFAIRVLKPTVIKTQPISLSGLCEGDDMLALSVQADGENLIYQWYFEGTPIPGANGSTYETPFTMDLQGEYYVEVIGTCGVVESERVTVTASPNIIQEKWDDVLYIGNPDGLFVRYQWYKNGSSIMTDATSQYYTDPKGFVGTYRVRAYYADGSYIESCPIKLNNPKMVKMVLFPNPVRSGEMYKIQLEGDYLENANLEVYDALGKFLESHPMTGDYIELRAWYAAGPYAIRIITKDQGIKVLKLIVE